MLVDNFGGLGGAVYCLNCFSIDFSNSPKFSYNIAYQGGFMFLDYDVKTYCMNNS